MPTLHHGFSAVILAGGRSQRMGQPKAWLPLGGVPLLQRVAARVRALVDEIIVVAAAEQELPELDARLLRDRTPAGGPLPALALGLEAVTTPYAFALACDAPFVRPAILRLLAAEVAAADAAIPVWDERPQPLVAVYRRELAAQLAALAAAGERRLHVVATLPRVVLIGADRLNACDPDGASFRMLNTPQEYAAAVAAFDRQDAGA